MLPSRKLDPLLILWISWDFRKEERSTVFVMLESWTKAKTSRSQETVLFHRCINGETWKIKSCPLQNMKVT